jgi:hypothetical protein
MDCPEPSFGRWACYDHHARQWVSRDRLETLAADWMERQRIAYAGKNPGDPEVMDGFVSSGDWADWEFLQAPQDCGEGFILKHDLKRIDELNAQEWEMHRKRIMRRR